MCSNHVGPQHELFYACPFLIGYPTGWMGGKCMIQRTDRVRHTLIRHHVLGYHKGLNASLATSDPRHRRPELFREIKDGLRKQRNEFAAWTWVYGQIEGVSDEVAASQNPYWSLHRLHAMLGTTLNAEIGPQEINHNAAITEQLMERIQRTEDLLINTCESSTNKMRDDIRNCMEQVRAEITTHVAGHMSGPMSMSTDDADNSQSTQGTGSIFQDQHEEMEDMLDLESADLLAGDDASISQVSGYANNSFTQLLNSQVDVSRMTAYYGEAASRSPAFLSAAVTPGQGRSSAEWTSDRTTSAMTPYSSSVYENSHGYHES